MNRSLMRTALAAALFGLVGAALAVPKGSVVFNQKEVSNPYSPAYGHPYRHGVIPTRDQHAKMKQWESAHAVHAAATGSETLSYGGGTSSSSQGNVGVMDGHVKVYLVF